LEVDTITINTATSGTVKFVDAITGESLIVTVINNSRYSKEYYIKTTPLFDGQAYQIKVNQAGTKVSLIWDSSIGDVREGEFIPVNRNGYRRLLEVDTITIATPTQGTVKFRDSLTGEIITTTVKNNSRYYTVTTKLFDGLDYVVNVNQNGLKVNLTWSPFSKTEAPKIKLADGGWIAIGSVKQLADTYNLDSNNLNIREGEENWPGILYIEDNAQDMVLVSFSYVGTGVWVQPIKPYTTMTTIGWKKDDCTY